MELEIDLGPWRSKGPRMVHAVEVVVVMAGTVGRTGVRRLERLVSLVDDHVAKVYSQTDRTLLDPFNSFLGVVINPAKGQNLYHQVTGNSVTLGLIRSTCHDR